MKVLEICGSKGFSAFQSFNHLMLGLKMLPSYMADEFSRKFMVFPHKDPF